MKKIRIKHSKLPATQCFFWPTFQTYRLFLRNTEILWYVYLKILTILPLKSLFMSILCCQKVFTGIYKCATRLLNMDLTSTLLNNENCNICARKRPLHWLHSVSFVQFPWPLLAINCILTIFFIYSTAYTAYTANEAFTAALDCTELY